MIPFGLLCIQVDHLDTLTATHGLDAAEAILNVVAHTLRNGLDPSDFVGRWSEDQFLAIVTNCGDGDLLTTAERLKRLAQSSEIAWWGDPLSVTVSVGGTVTRPGEDVVPLLDRTGTALKQAVAKGGNFAIVLCAPETTQVRIKSLKSVNQVFAIIGIVVVFGAVIAGYLMEHGNIKVLLQPAELLIIGGAGVGTLLISNPLHILKSIAAALPGIFKGSKFTKAWYLDSLKMMYELFGRARRDGLVALESDTDDPEKSQIFSKYPDFLKDHHLLCFVCDTMRLVASNAVEAFELDQMVELDMDVHHHDSTQPVAALSTMADSLPGLGIVAAVLGVVITMGALGGPPEEIGHKVAAALVGTFLGILLCYGLVGPLASNMAKAADDEHAYLYVLRVAMASFIKGTAPIMAVEVARRAIPGHVRPTFQELETYCRNKGEAAAPKEAAV